MPFPLAVTTGALALAILAPTTATAGASHRPDRGAPGDPWEKFNRRMFAFNMKIDHAILVPLSRLTSGLTPGLIGRAIHNFVVNLHEPVVIVNDLLQARPGPAVRSAFRLLVNSTAGGLGAVDVAKALGDPAHKNGFGDTLGRWGASAGPYLVVPVLGPSTVRDLFGSVVDDATEPIQFIKYPYRTEVDFTTSILGGLNERAELGPQYEALLAGAADPYATLRSSYLQSREAEIRGDKALPPLPDIEDATPPPSASTDASPPPQGEQDRGTVEGVPAPAASPSPPPSPPSGVLPPQGEESAHPGDTPSVGVGEGNAEGMEAGSASEAAFDETRL